MFGFGLSAFDKGLQEKIANTLRALGNPADSIEPRARGLFKAAKDEAERTFGTYIYVTNLGEKLIQGNSETYQQRLTAGLTENDIRQHWNRPPILFFVEEKIRNVFVLKYLEAEEKRGVAKMQALAQYRKINPLYGDPVAWNSSLPVNVGLSEVDAPLYPEFSTRIERWREKTGSEQVEMMLTNYQSLNALLRNMVSRSEL